MVDLLEARAFAYDTLKCVFLDEPSETLLRLLIEGDVVSAFPFAHAGAAIGQALELVGRYLGQPDAASRGSCERLRWDYTRMFIAPGPVPAPPWESIYRDAERLHLSEHTLEVRAAYQKHGLSASDFGREPDDHIGLELDFLHRLCETALKRAEEADEPALLAILADQRAFLDEHLLRWVPAWAADVVRSAETDFYRGMARLVEAYVLLDRELVEELLEALLPDVPRSSG